MAGFSTYDSIINALTVSGYGQRVWFNKDSYVTVGTSYYDFWMGSGSPAAGTWGVHGTGRAIDNTFAAALPFTNAGATRTMHLLSMGVGSSIILGSLLLYDRLAEYPFDGTDTANDFNAGAGVALPARDAIGGTNGVGCALIVENFSATACTAQTFTPTYTDSAGVDRTAAAVLFASGTSGKRIVHPVANGIFWPLNAAGTGIRLIKSYTLGASCLSPQMCATIIRPIAVVPVMTADSYVERDFVLQLAALPRLYDGTALSFILLAGATTCPMWGSVLFAEN